MSESERAIEIPLSMRGEKPGLVAIVVLFFGMGLAAAFVEGPILGKLVCALLSSFGALFVAFLARSTLDRAVLLSTESLVLRKGRAETGRVVWSDVARVELHIRTVNELSFVDDEGSTRLCLPMQLIGNRANELYSLLETFLGADVPIVYVLPKTTMSPGWFRAFAWGGTCLGIGQLALSMDGVSSGMGTPLFSWSAWLLLSGIVTLGIGAGAFMGLWRARHRDQRPSEIPIRARLANSLLIDLRRGEAGLSVSSGVYEYPEAIRTLSLRREINSTAIATTIFAAFLLCLGIYMATFLAVPKRGHDGAPFFASVVLLILSAAFAILYAGLAYTRQIRELEQGLGDRVRMDGDRLWVIQDGRAVPATLGTIRYNDALGSTKGINSMRMCLSVEGENRWYDPSAMTRCEE